MNLAFETLLGRSPTETELASSLTFLVEASAAGATSDGAASEAQDKSSVQPPAADPLERAKENFIMALFNHNDFVTVR